MPAVFVWLANIDNPNTRRAYQSDVEAFVSFCGIEQPDELRQVTRAHVIAWRSDLESQELSAATVRRKLSAVSRELLRHKAGLVEFGYEPQLGNPGCRQAAVRGL